MLVVALAFGLIYAVATFTYTPRGTADSTPEPPKPKPRFSVHPTDVRLGSYSYLGIIVDELTGQQYLYAHCLGYGNRTDAIAITPLLPAPETSKENPHE